MRMRVEKSTRPDFGRVAGYPLQLVMVIDPAIESDYGTGCERSRLSRADGRLVVSDCAMVTLPCRAGSGIIGGRRGVPAFGGAVE
jgi:hypothetical protein